MNSNDFYFSSLYRDTPPSSRCYHVAISNRLEVLKNSIPTEKGKGQFERFAARLPLRPGVVLIREVHDEDETRKGEQKEEGEVASPARKEEKFTIISLAALWKLLYNDASNVWETIGEKFGTLSDLWEKKYENWVKTNEVNASEAPKVSIELGQRIEKDTSGNILDVHQNLLVLSCYGQAASLERQNDKRLRLVYEKLEFHHININVKMASTKNARRSQKTHLQARVEGNTFGLNFDNSGISMPLPSFLNLVNSHGIRKIMKDSKARVGPGNLSDEENYRDIVVCMQPPNAKGSDRSSKRPKLDTRNPFAQLMMRGVESHQVKKLLNNPPMTEVGDDIGAEARVSDQVLENEGSEDVQGTSGTAADDYDFSQYF